MGQTVITASSVQNETKKGLCAVNVTPLIIPVTGITLDKETLTLDIGQKEIPTATVLPPDATNPAIHWSSDKPTIADVSQTGEVTALSPGAATIKAASLPYPAVAGECVVNVSEADNVYVAGAVTRTAEENVSRCPWGQTNQRIRLRSTCL